MVLAYKSALGLSSHTPNVISNSLNFGLNRINGAQGFNSNDYYGFGQGQRPPHQRYQYDHAIDRDMFMAIAPISKKQFRKITPSRVTPEQYQAYWGINKMEKLQRILESVLVSYGGAWIAWFLSFMLGSFFSSVFGTVMIFNWMYTPLIFAHRMNRSLWSTTMPYHYSVLFGKISSLKKFRQRSGKTIGGVSQEYLCAVIDDERGRELEVITHWKDEYHALKRGMSCSTALVSKDSDFSSVHHITEVYVPSCSLWLGEFPYLKRGEFLKLVDKIISENSNNDIQLLNNGQEIISTYKPGQSFF